MKRKLRRRRPLYNENERQEEKDEDLDGVPANALPPLLLLLRRHVPLQPRREHPLPPPLGEEVDGKLFSDGENFGEALELHLRGEKGVSEGDRRDEGKGLRTVPN